MKSYFYMALQQNKKTKGKHNAAREPLKGREGVVVKPKARVGSPANWTLVKLKRAGVAEALFARAAFH